MRLGLIAAFLAALVALRVPLCPFAIVTRHPCPGCGMTRAALALAQGHVMEALHFHPLALPVVPVAAFLAAQGSYTYIRTGRWRTLAVSMSPLITISSIVVGVAMLAIWIARFFGFLGGPVPV